MTRIPVITLAAAALLVAAVSLGAGKKYKLSYITVHTEGDATDNPKMVVPVKLGSEHRQYFFSKIPSFTDADVEWFYPFRSRDGASFGTAFKLRNHGLQELKGITLTNQGKLLGIRVSDGPLSAVLIDRPITDGVIVVWEGLSQKNLAEFSRRFPHVDQFRAQEGPQFALPQSGQ